MRVPISDKAEELLKDPEKARALAEAIRESRKKGRNWADVRFDGKELTVRLVGSKSTTVDA